MIKVLFLAAEAEPFIKLGGLADVAGSLPLALRDLGGPDPAQEPIDIRLAIPLHRMGRIDMASLHVVSDFPVFRSGGNVTARLYETVHSGLPVYFVDGAPISSESSVYSNDPSLDREKYAFFSMASLEMTRYLDWQPDIVHVNDWHTALACYALHLRRKNPSFINIRTMLTLHNLPYMGGDGSDVLSAYGLQKLEDGNVPEWARTQPLPLGLASADSIIPVSPTYAREILTPEYGCGLEGFLQSRAQSITGILNGLDVAGWDPTSDSVLAAPFDVDDFSGRAVNKEALQKQLGLALEARTPLLAMVGRVDPQKGVDIALAALSLFAEHPWQFILLGTGDHQLETAATNLQAIFPDRIRAVTRFDPGLSRLIYGGADMFLMPSRDEPCGLAQMIAMHYGCVPVVRITGGLKDTVTEGKTGFLFEKPTPEALAEALARAFVLYHSAAPWKRFQRNGMKEDFSWRRSVRQYAVFYRSLLPNPGG